MTNRLAKTNSPYLLQHAENPVDWYPWGPEALQKATREDKPIFLSIGYAACHWCHVMAHESFEDPGTAEIMNRHFVNIKVDREERPDLDSIYMTAVVALTGQGGWPMSVFLTPQGEPFYGGTYFPPTQRYNLPSFRDILTGVARAWDENRERLLQSSAELARHIRAGGRVEAGQPDQLEPAMLDRAALSLAQSYDWKHGGWGRAPKFPQPMAIEFLLQRATGGDRLALDVATHALKAMARGGMYDVIGGGFARYSTDDRWLVPHFEKMLYDNALLADAYLHAYLITRDEEFRRVCEATLDFVAREMRDASGAFYSSLDADSEGKEGKYYIWAWEEIKAAIPDQIDFDLCTAAYGISESGNFEGNNVLQRTLDDEHLAQKFSLPAEEIRARLESARQRLLAERSRRVRPGTDDKALASWNALMLKAFAEAARFLDRPDYAKVAVQNAEFLTSELLAGGKLQRAWRNGQAAHAGYLEDYAATIQGLLALYQSVPDVRWFAMAKELARQMLEHFQDPVGGFFDTSDQHEHLLVRPKDLQDNAIPCGNSLAAYALLELAAFDGEQAWREIAERSLGMFEAAVQQYPTAFAYWLCAFRFAIEMTTEVAITWPLPAGRPWSSIRSGQAPADPGDSQLLIRELWRAYRPNLVAALSPYPVPEGSPQLLADRPPIKGQLTAYVCRSFVCQLPVTTPQALAEQLQELQEH